MRIHADSNIAVCHIRCDVYQFFQEPISYFLIVDGVRPDILMFTLTQIKGPSGLLTYVANPNVISTTDDRKFPQLMWGT